MERYRELAELQRNWQPPAELSRSSPREVQLTGGGVAVACLAAALVIGGFAAQILLSRVVAHETAERNALAASGVETQAVVTRHWRKGGKDSDHRIAYSFEHDGRVYQATVRTPRRIWARLAVGAPIRVRYAPDRPELNHPVEWTSVDTPAWLPPMIAAALIATALLIVWLIRRQMRLLSEGRAAPALVVGHTRVKHGQMLRYEFPLLDGGVGKGRGGQSRRPPPVGATICILYDRDNPKRNAPYPFDLARVVR